MTESPLQNPNDSPRQLSDGVRTLISLLLVVQLFALAVVVFAHTGQTELTDQIRRRVPLLQPYMRRLWMDHSYMYADYVNPHRDAQVDSQFVLEVELDEDGATRRITLPDAAVWSNLRRQRYLALARNLASIVGSDIEAEYAGMIATGLLAEHPNATSLRLACVQQFTPSTSDEPPDHPNAVLHEDGSYTATVYRCQAWADPQTGVVEIRKEEEARRLAPVTKNDQQN